MDDFHAILSASKVNYDQKVMTELKDLLQAFKGSVMVVESLSKGKLVQFLMEKRLTSNIDGSLLINHRRLLYELELLSIEDIKTKGIANEESVNKVMKRIKEKTNCDLILASMGHPKKDDLYQLTAAYSTGGNQNSQTITFQTTAHESSEKSTQLSLSLWRHLLNLHKNTIKT